MEKRKRNSKKTLIALILLFISFSLFITSTFAWFTDTATVKGNKIFAGNLYVDVITDFDGLLEAGLVSGDEGDYSVTNGSITLDDGTTTISVLEKTYTDGVSDTSKKYYVLTDVEAPYISLYNVEPGQAFPVKFGVFNSGDLAVKYTAGFQIAKDEENNPKSYTGLETLEKQHEGTFDTYHNKYLASTGTIGSDREDPDYTLDQDLQTNTDEYNRRKTKLEKMQANSSIPEGEEGHDIGGHLEDVLEVYIVDDASRDLNGNPTRSAIKDENYVGTIKEIINATDSTYSPSSDEERSELELIKERIQETSKGYLLPGETIIDENNKQATDGVTVNIYDIVDGDDMFLDSRNNVSDIGEVEYIIYMPEDASNLYQNASLFLDMGITGTQVEFEYDGFNYMVYDSDYDYTEEIDPTPHDVNILLNIPSVGEPEYIATLPVGVLKNNYHNITLTSTNGFDNLNCDLIFKPFGNNHYFYILKDNNADRLYFLFTDEASTYDSSLFFKDGFSTYKETLYNEIDQYIDNYMTDSDHLVIVGDDDADMSTVLDFIVTDIIYYEIGELGRYRSPIYEIANTYTNLFNFLPTRMYDIPDNMTLSGYAVDAVE